MLVIAIVIGSEVDLCKQKQTNVGLKSTFIQEYLEGRPFYKYNWDAIIVKLSKLYNLVRTRGHPVQGDSSAGGNQSAFVRQTTKYWVSKYVHGLTRTTNAFLAGTSRQLGAPQTSYIEALACSRWVENTDSHTVFFTHLFQSSILIRNSS